MGRFGYFYLPFYKGNTDSEKVYRMRRKDLRQTFITSRNTLVRYAMLMAMELSSFCLDNDSDEDQVLNKNNRNLYMEIFERVIKAIELDTRYLKKIKEYDVSDMNTCDDLMDYIQYSYPKIIGSLHDESFSLDKVISELEVYDTELKKIRENLIKYK